ncbi:uncharacterized protein [Eurosta solidaginis]|uniref:uncharacterized protein isoform X2 n=1 Tax=Eurosta solidaginis TaxID=178769 RepID=UPI0035313874
MKVLFFNLRAVKLNLRESAKLVVEEVNIFWDKGRIPTRTKQHCITKLEDLYNAWRKVNKNSKNKSETLREREEAWTPKLDDLFDIASANAVNLIKNSEEKLFLENQRKKGRPGYMYVIDYKTAVSEERMEERQQNHLKRKAQSDCALPASNERAEFSSCSSECDLSEIAAGYEPTSAKKM